MYHYQKQQVLRVFISLRRNKSKPTREGEDRRSLKNENKDKLRGSIVTMVTIRKEESSGGRERNGSALEDSTSPG